MRLGRESFPIRLVDNNCLAANRCGQESIDGAGEFIDSERLGKCFDARVMGNDQFDLL